MKFLRRPIILEEVAVVGERGVDEPDPLQVLLWQIVPRTTVHDELVRGAVDFVELQCVVDHIL